jgi:hypothetical protein
MLRKGPSESATAFSPGVQKKGNDGNMWEIIKTSAGTQRWKKLTKNKTQKRGAVTGAQSVTVAQLQAMKKKYHVSTTGSKTEIAMGLYRVSGFKMSSADLQLIQSLLPRKEQKKIQKLGNKRDTHIITNYKGMWTSKPANFSGLSRDDIIMHLREFRDAWESNTKRSQDLDDVSLSTASTAFLKMRLRWYYSEEAKIMAADFLTDGKK